MQSTSIRVSIPTRDELRQLADADGVSLDEALRRLTRSERQRRMGAALAAPAATPDDDAWLAMSVNEASTEP